MEAEYLIRKDFRVTHAPKGRNISARCSYTSSRACLTSLIKDPSLSQRPSQDVIEGIPPILRVLVAVD